MAQLGPDRRRLRRRPDRLHHPLPPSGGRAEAGGNRLTTTYGITRIKRSRQWALMVLATVVFPLAWALMVLGVWKLAEIVAESREIGW